jgi:hypothetical protein
MKQRSVNELPSIYGQGRELLGLLGSKPILNLVSDRAPGAQRITEEELQLISACCKIYAATGAGSR